MTLYRSMQEEAKQPVATPVSEPVAPAQAEVVKERNRWFYSLQTPKKQEKLFELEVLLKGLDRFFNLANQPISEMEAVVNREFTNELLIIKNAVGRVVRLCKGLLSADDNRALHFRNYVETRLLNDYQRAKRIERALLQRTPEESLYVLTHSFINFQEILASVVSHSKNSYFLFYHLEQLIGREIAGNRYFNPFKAAGFAPHYDVIKSPRFAGLVRAIADPALRKHMSIIFLMMFKLLRYFSFINPEQKDLAALKDSLLIFSLVNSESTLLSDLIENEVSRVVKDADGLPPQRKDLLISAMDAFSYQLTVELEKIFELELKDAAKEQDVTTLRNGVARSRGLLTNIFQQGIVGIGQALDPELEGRDVFPDFVSKIEESLRLRRDVWLFHKVVENLEQVIEKSREQGSAVPLIEAIKTTRNFIFYYQNISFQYVRSMDREEFHNFFQMMDKFVVSDIDQSKKLEDFARNLHAFKMFLETTLANINNRAELRDMPFGRKEGERILSQFLG